MPINKEKILLFLLTADFSKNYGHSYNELLEYLNNYQYHYKKIYESNDSIKSELHHRDKVLENLNIRIKDLEEKVKLQSEQIFNLKQYLKRNLTFWERISGKVKI